MNTDRPGGLAVVTGASGGIGYELARLCTEHDLDVLLVAERGVEQAAGRLTRSGVAVHPLEADLATYEGNERVVAAVARHGGTASVLILNAGVGVAGPFLETALEDDLALVALNVGSVIHLAKRLLPAMTSRGAGRVLITSSIAAAMPGPYYATYAASKAFLLSFAEAVRHELADTGVTVTALQPGPTDTEFFDRAGMQDTPVYAAKKDDAAEVASEAFRAMMSGDDKVIAGSAKNALQVGAARMLTEPAKAAMHARQTEPDR